LCLHTNVYPVVRSLNTRVGCSDTIECSAANVTDIQWSTSRFHIELIKTCYLGRFCNVPILWCNTTCFMTSVLNPFLCACHCSQVTTNGSVTTAFLSFTNISTEEVGSYTCFMFYSDHVYSRSIIVTVNQSKIMFHWEVWSLDYLTELFVIETVYDSWTIVCIRIVYILLE